MVRESVESNKKRVSLATDWDSSFAFGMQTLSYIVIVVKKMGGIKKRTEENDEEEKKKKK